MAYHESVNLNSSTWTQLTATVVCKEIILQEPAEASTAGILVASPTDNSVFTTFAAGALLRFISTKANWDAGQAVAQLKLTSGSVVFDKMSQ